jgi:hypothetical protein
MSTNGRYVVRRPEGKKPLRKPRHKWGDNMEMHLKDKG